MRQHKAARRFADCSIVRGCRLPGWTIPIEPLFEPLRSLHAFREILATPDRSRPLISQFFIQRTCFSARHAYTRWCGASLALGSDAEGSALSRRQLLRLALL